MGIATIFAAVSTTNTGIQSCPRMLAGSGSDGTMPKVFVKKNKNGAPYFSILFMGLKLFNIPQISAIFILLYLVYIMIKDKFVLIGSAVTIAIILTYAILWSICKLKRFPFKPVPNPDIDDLEASIKPYTKQDTQLNSAINYSKF